MLNLLLNIFGSITTRTISTWENIDGMNMLVDRSKTIKRNSYGIIIDVQDKVVYHLPDIC